MSDKKVSLIAAMGKNRAIGLDGRMPWHLPSELQHFKATTMGKSILMGRKTWESIGRPLPGRQNVVVTRNPDFIAPGAEVFGSLEQAIASSDTDEVMVIGGGQLYAAVLPRAQRMVLTLIDLEPEADTWFPEWEASQWELKTEQRFDANQENPVSYQIIELTRKN